MNALVKDILTSVGKKFLKDAIDIIPSKIELDFDNVKNFLLEKDQKKPDLRSIMSVSGKSYRKQVMVFDDDKYNKSQY